MNLPQAQYQAQISYPGSAKFVPGQTRELAIPGVRSPDAINGHALYTEIENNKHLEQSNLFAVRKTPTTRLPTIPEENELAFVRSGRITTSTRLPPIPEEDETDFVRNHRPVIPTTTRLPPIAEEEYRLRNSVVPQARLSDEELLLQQEQAQNAHYTFGTSIDDSINDHAIHRQETRSGLALKGMYSYSDGYFKRTIHYEADENGYRVVKSVPLPHSLF